MTVSEDRLNHIKNFVIGLTDQEMMEALLETASEIQRRYKAEQDPQLKKTVRSLMTAVRDYGLRKYQ